MNAAVADFVSAAITQTTRAWSPYQTGIFTWVVDGTGNAIVEAVAGSGKSTTVEEATKRFRGSCIVVAFNKSTAEGMKARGVNGRTFHSLCYGVVLRHLGANEVTTNKLQQLLRANFGEDVIKSHGAFMTRMVGLARQAGIGAGLCQNVVSEWLALAAHHDIEPDKENADMTEAAELAMSLLALSNASPMVDFDDLLYVAVRDGLSLPKFQLVCVDEAQDTNAIQRALIRKIMGPFSRLMAVGDPAQAIYGFRGADSDSMDLLAHEFGCIRLPLTVSYRCPKAVVEWAHTWVDHIEAAPGAPDGVVKELESWSHKDFASNDLVVCRTTRPLISLAYTLIRARIPAHVMGREIGQGLKKLVEKMKAHGIDALLAKLDTYTVREAEKAIAKGDDAKAEAIRDKTACVVCIIDGLSENERTVPALLNAIDQLFSDNSGSGVTLATIHKAKGMEADRVFWLNASQCPAKWAKQEWQQDQERNLCYVATTRAKAELYLIEEDDQR